MRLYNNPSERERLHVRVVRGATGSPEFDGLAWDWDGTVPLWVPLSHVCLLVSRSPLRRHRRRISYTVERRSERASESICNVEDDTETLDRTAEDGRAGGWVAWPHTLAIRRRLRRRCKLGRDE